ncbi:MAG: sulfatase-like hydrolase/transferase, partial [Planctomycetes bacterium]|nr:sulfatase-like hydrolase/transferase [Planctomycetota bacterium]
CSPNRCVPMMGMYTQRDGKYGLSRRVPIPDDQPTLAETLRDAGYTTGIVGLEKWDIGRWDQGCLDRGFMEAGMHPPRAEGMEGFGGGAAYRSIDGSYLTETEGGYVLDFIERHGHDDKPFLMYFKPLTVHVPHIEVPVKYLKRLYPDHTGKYASRQYLRATLLALDDQVGLIRKKLDDMGIAEDTLIMFSSDNGGDPDAGHRPLPYRGGKKGKNRFNLQWEGNFRMPTILTMPGTLPRGKEYKGMASTMDFYATAAAVAKTKLPDHCEGKDLLPLLCGEQTPDPDNAYFWHTYTSRASRWKQWRLVKFGKEEDWRLYHIEEDPGETTDIALKHPEVVKEMDTRFTAWRNQMPEPAKPVKPPAHLLQHTQKGNHARRPFGYGFMTVEEWDQIKDDPTQWSEYHARKKLLSEK